MITEAWAPDLGGSQFSGAPECWDGLPGLAGQGTAAARWSGLQLGQVRWSLPIPAGHGAEGPPSPAADLTAGLGVRPGSHRSRRSPPNALRRDCSDRNQQPGAVPSPGHGARSQCLGAIQHHGRGLCEALREAADQAPPPLPPQGWQVLQRTPGAACQMATRPRPPAPMQGISIENQIGQAQAQIRPQSSDDVMAEVG